ncbi:MAG: 1-(5-phosphoribosyl)-5-[(5-phosphoribosylamino)methylideneamino]imidazole-4-carboxamide isomerase [Candidatus Brocadiia bacterium]
MIILPAVDIQDGHCVRLLKGQPDTAETYYQDPVRAAQHWETSGAEALHVVDLDGALKTDVNNKGPAERIIQSLSIPVEIGGGLRSKQAVQSILKAGAARAVVGTRAATDPEWAIDLCQSFPDKIVIALDARDGTVSIKGWQESAGISVEMLADRLSEGAPAAFLYTDISRDGMLSEPNYEGVETLLETTDIPVIASGGVSSIDDIRRLGECGADGVVTGKALYEQRVDLEQALEVASEFDTRLNPRAKMQEINR